MDAIINNVTLANANRQISIGIKGGKIDTVSSHRLNHAGALQLSFKDAIVFPGLINSHDHLDFNLFPQLGYQVYDSYVHWGRHIHKIYATEITDILKIPTLLREQWGVYKNLLCGVCTVVNHGKKVAAGQRMIRIWENSQSLHSVRFEKYWKWKLNNPANISRPVTIHVGEGTDTAAQREIDELIRWNLLGRTLIGIHGVALTSRQARHFKGLVWCPHSNYFLLSKTADVQQLKQHLPVVFGSDSTLTGPWNIWEHIRLARSTQQLSDAELYAALTRTPAAIWGINAGEIASGRDADLVVARTKGETDSLSAFFNTNPADLLMVMHKGEVKLVDACLADRLEGLIRHNFSKIYIDGTCKYVEGNLSRLMHDIKGHCPAAGFPVWVNNNNLPDNQPT